MALNRIKKGDNVQMLIGKDKGKKGSVLEIRPDGRIVIAKLNIVKKHTRPKKQGEKGQVIEIPRAVDASNVMLVCPGCKKPSRVGLRLEGKDKLRFCKKCKSVI